MVAPSSTSTSLKEYLKKYESNTNEEGKKKQKKKKKVKPNDVKGVVVVDEDPVWQKPVKIEDEEDESAGNVFQRFVFVDFLYPLVLVYLCLLTVFFYR